MGAPLAARLHGDGINAIDIRAKLATRVRTLSVGHGRKNDDADAISVGIAALTARGLRGAAVEQSSSRCVPWSSTVTTSYAPALRRSTGCTCCLPSCCPAEHLEDSTPTPLLNCYPRCVPAPPGRALCDG
jgi:hypothetical protein